MADDFTRTRSIWLTEIRRDPRVGHLLAFRLACELAEYLNRQTGDAYPSIDTLAAALHVDRRSVQRAIEKLVACGYLEVTDRRGGRTNTSHYRPKLAGEPVQIAERGAPTPPFPDAKRGASGSEKGGVRVREGRRPRRPNLLNEPTDEPKESAALRAASRAGAREAQGFSGLEAKARNGLDPAMAEAFASFWSTYPRKEGRRKAELAFAKILASGKATVDELIHGVVRFALAQRGQEQRYIPLPVNWLRDERWRDEPTPAPPARPQEKRLGEQPSDRPHFDEDDEEARQRRAAELRAERQRCAADAAGPDPWRQVGNVVRGTDGKQRRH